MSTHFSGPIVSTGGFEGDITGNVTGNVTGNITGDIAGFVTKQSETVAATSTGAEMSADVDFVTLTSAGANNIAILPTPVAGKVIRGAIAGTGCEIRSSSPTGIAINGTTGSAVEAALAANSSFEAVALSSAAWRLLNYTSTGVESNPIPD